MKKKISILLLILFLFDVTGFFLVFITKREIIRSDIKQQIKKDLPLEELVLIVDSGPEKSEIKWKEKGEFRFKGEMYDVVKCIVNAKGFICYYCIADKAETGLYRQFDGLIQFKLNHNDNTPHGKHFLLKLYKTIYPLIIHPVRILLNASENTCYHKNIFYQSEFTHVDIPPPKTDNIF